MTIISVKMMRDFKDLLESFVPVPFSAANLPPNYNNPFPDPWWPLLTHILVKTT